jgi:hypothetical protein
MVQTVVKKGGQTPKVKGKADVVLVIDITGSMSGCLENLKNNLLELLSKIEEFSKEEGVAEPDVSFNVIGFRDLEEDEKNNMLIMNENFTNNLDDLKDFFSKPEMQAAGGGDVPESSLDALYVAATKLSWTKPAKIIVLFTDASPKPTFHRSTSGVDLGEKETLAKLKEVLSGKRVVIFGPKGVKEFDLIGAIEKCIYQGFENAEESLKDFNDPNLFKENVVKMIAKTATQEMKTKKWNP